MHNRFVATFSVQTGQNMPKIPTFVTTISISQMSIVKLACTMPWRELKIEEFTTQIV